MEIRSFDGIGMPEIEQTEAGNRITGYAIVFNSRSERLYDPFTRREFVEIIDANAVGEELLKRSDIKALYNHDRNRLLARSTNGEGTLSLSIDDKGLRYSFTAPNTEYGREVKELIKRGDLRGSSFAFTFDENDVEETRDKDTKLIIRTIKRISGLYDVSVVCDPAYQSTNVGLRSLPEEAPTNEEKTKEEAPTKEEDTKEEPKVFGKGDTKTARAIKILIG